MNVCSCSNPDCLANGCLQTRPRIIDSYRNEYVVTLPFVIPSNIELPAVDSGKIVRVTMPVPQGWECPKCTKVYGPHVDECGKCGSA